MNRRRGVALAGLAAAGVAVANRLLAARAGELEPALGGDVGRFHWRGFDVEYAEGGDPEDPDVLLVHGVHAAASAKEFDRLFDDLSRSYHVLAPDLPGFGRSDRPPVVYTHGLYAAFLADFAREATADAVCVASSLSANVAAAVQADRAPFSRLVLLCPTDDTGRRRAWVRELFRAPLVGTALFDLLASRPSLRWFSERLSVSDPAAMTAADVDYYWRTAHQPGARFAPASFVGGDLDPPVALADVLAGLDVPVTLVWGADATQPSVGYGRALADRTGARLVVVEDAKLLPHHEHPERVLEALASELPRLEDG